MDGRAHRASPARPPTGLTAPTRERSLLADQFTFFCSEGDSRRNDSLKRCRSCRQLGDARCAMAVHQERQRRLAFCVTIVRAHCQRAQRDPRGHAHDGAARDGRPSEATAQRESSAMRARTARWCRRDRSSRGAPRTSVRCFPMRIRPIALRRTGLSDRFRRGRAVPSAEIAHRQVGEAGRLSERRPTPSALRRLRRPLPELRAALCDTRGGRSAGTSRSTACAPRCC
jgi:hypothetical protein